VQSGLVLVCHLAAPCWPPGDDVLQPKLGVVLWVTTREGGSFDDGTVGTVNAREIMSEWLERKVP